MPKMVHPGSHAAQELVAGTGAGAWATKAAPSNLGLSDDKWFLTVKPSGFKGCGVPKMGNH